MWNYYPYMYPRRITQCNTVGDMHLIVYVLFVFFFVMQHDSPRSGKMSTRIDAMPGYFARVVHQVSNSNVVEYCNIKHNE
jgi:hypothetical protein